MWGEQTQVRDPSAHKVAPPHPTTTNYITHFYRDSHSLYLLKVSTYYMPGTWEGFCVPSLISPLQQLEEVGAVITSIL